MPAAETENAVLYPISLPSGPLPQKTTMAAASPAQRDSKYNSYAHLIQQLLTHRSTSHTHPVTKEGLSILVSRHQQHHSKYSHTTPQDTSPSLYVPET